LQKPFGRIISIPELERLEKGVKRTHYKGQKTKKYKRFLKMERKAHVALYAATKNLERRFG
jgi:hypothetical protein